VPVLLKCSFTRCVRVVKKSPLRGENLMGDDPFICWLGK
jgi:hypothetical protein